MYRLVESQEHIATRQLVDTLEEQAILEEMLETVKPPYPHHSGHLHYLLKTPFRYPPLKWGSRFGRTFEPSIFYGGCSVDVTLAESAYYRFVFWHSMDGKPPKNTLRSEHTLFSVGYHSDQGIQLQSAPFDVHLDLIAHPINYSHPQQLGTAMRNDGVAVFEYPSARASNHATSHATCVGLFTASAFSQHSPLDRQQWFCDVGSDEVIFKAVECSHIFYFELSQFLYQGVFAMPA
ncbi:RES family NAD+ phosphorylase [Alkanindiges sp. WGS2144]|uniref:RES family NAD+ phosphorylase n=1 Tax=Alkanindiges sp. WGS2144 TaxID=3366808 RepID=UPI003751EC4C